MISCVAFTVIIVYCFYTEIVVLANGDFSHCCPKDGLWAAYGYEDTRGSTCVIHVVDKLPLSSMYLQFHFFKKKRFRIE